MRAPRMASPLGVLLLCVLFLLLVGQGRRTPPAIRNPGPSLARPSRPGASERPPHPVLGYPPGGRGRMRGAWRCRDWSRPAQRTVVATFSIWRLICQPRATDGPTMGLGTLPPVGCGVWRRQKRRRRVKGNMTPLPRPLCKPDKPEGASGTLGGYATGGSGGTVWGKTPPKGRRTTAHTVRCGPADQGTHCFLFAKGRRCGDRGTAAKRFGGPARGGRGRITATRLYARFKLSSEGIAEKCGVTAGASHGQLARDAERRVCVCF